MCVLHVCLSARSIEGEQEIIQVGRLQAHCRRCFPYEDRFFCGKRVIIVQKGRRQVNQAKPKKDSRITVPDFTLRMQIALDMFPTCRVAADIGSDHGKLAVALLQTNACKRVIATDISAPCLAKARKAARAYKLEDRMEMRVGNGLLALSENEVEVAIIAGMGGELIAQILEEGKEVARPMKALLLQPMQHADLLRYY